MHVSANIRVYILQIVNFYLFLVYFVHFKPILASGNWQSPSTFHFLTSSQQGKDGFGDFANVD